MTDPHDIDQVAEAMQSIVMINRERRSPLGYFAAMYLGVTRVVARGLDDGIFTTPDRMARLTSVFANRYIGAWQAHDSGGESTEAWAVAFRAGERWRPTVLQHLLLGMNAHINLDLAIATAEVAPGVEIDELENDFTEINDVLAGLVSTVQSELNRISPLYRFVDDIAGPVDRAVINFSIARARAEAWKLALFLATADPTIAARRVTYHDRIVGAIGITIEHPGAVSSSGLLGLRLTEWRRPAAIIDILAGAAG